MPARSVRAAAGTLAALACLAGAAASSEPVSSLGIDAGDVEGDGWRAQGVAVNVTPLPDGGLSAVLRVASLTLPAPVGELRDLEAVCPRLLLNAQRLRCERLRLGGPPPWPPLAGTFEYRRADGRLQWQAAPDATAPADGAAAGTVAVSGDFGSPRRTLGLVLRDVALGPWATAWQESVTDPAADGLALDGRLDLDLDVSLPAGGSPTIVADGRLRELSGNNAAGTVAAEGVDLEFDLRLDGDAEPGFELHLGAAHGEVYRQPIYANLGEWPVTVAASGRVTADGVVVDDFRLEQAGIGAARGSGRAAAGADGGWVLRDADLTLTELRLPAAYDVLLQPFLAGTDLGDLETLGSARGELRVADGRVESLSLSLDEVYLDDRSGRLAVYGLYGDLAWGEAAVEAPMRIVWDGGFLYGIAYGAADLEFVRRADGIALAEPVSIPVLDGRLEIDQLELGGGGAERASAALDARLTPVDMRAVALALGWPPLSGTLSGRLPRLSYRDGELTLGGEFEAELFDGRIRVRDFSVREPLRPGARLRAELEIERLDLRQLTEAFSFGLITGRLDGYVHGLTMIDWEPVAFDARLFTSPKDPGRRRISQRAVDNIASLGGGGGAAALSSGFLRFFDDFAYDRIALGCRRELDVCHMSGIEPSGTGYLILRGRGLPRITVIGYAHEVSWSTLVGQLAAIVESEGPVIE